MVLFDVISHAKLIIIFYWPAAEPLAYARGTLGSAEPRLKITASE